MLDDHQLQGLRAARTKAGVPASKLAAALGIHINSYYRVENGTRRTYFDKVCVLADIIGCSVDELRRAPVAAGAPADAETVLEGWGDQS